MTDTELTELLQAAARGSGTDVRPDPSALICRARRARRRQRIVGLCGVVAVAVLGATAVPALLDKGEGGVEVAAGDEKEGFKPGWTRLSDPPLSPRVRASTAWTGKEIVVVGGSIERCPVAAGCGGGSESLLSDGAAYDVAARTWRAMAPSPVPITSQMGVAEVGGNVFVLASCQPPACKESAALLRYRSADDAWDVLPAPPGGSASFRLSGSGSSVLAYDLGGIESPTIWRFDATSSSWTALPRPPFSNPLNQPVVLGHGDDVLVFGQDLLRTKNSISSGRDLIAGARHSSATGAWTPLAGARGSRVQPRVLDGLVVLNPGLQESTGGILDLATGAWVPLPTGPVASISPFLGVDPSNQLAGALGSTAATFDATSGWVLDLPAATWVQVPPIDDRTSGDSFTAFGRRLFSFGGMRFPGAGELLNDAWVWTAPARGEAPPPPPVTTPPSLEAATPPIGPTPTSAPTATAPPATPGAPVFVSAEGDAAAGRVTLRFDRPVTGDPVDKSPGSKTFSPDKTHPMNMIVFGPDKACSGPQGNGQDYVSGLGTDTVTLAATSLAAGTTYVGIGRGVVKSAADGTFNDAVVGRDLPQAGMFTGMSCIPVKVTGSVPTTQPYTDPVGGPKLLSATASAGGGGPGVPGGAGAGRVTLKFDRPVVPGDGPNFDGSSPNLQPAAGDNYMRAMQLVVHTTDSSCSSPNGNAHEYLSGVGTDTLVVDATSLVVGTTYVSINPGFAKGKADGKPMSWVRCLAVQVTA